MEEFRASHELQVNDIQEALEEDWFEPGLVITHKDLDYHFGRRDRIVMKLPR